MSDEVEQDVGAATAEHISAWIEQNTDTVSTAQKLALFVIEAGLSDTRRTLPFQIVPINKERTEFLTSIYIDHPVYGTILAHVNAPDNFAFQFFDDWWYPFENAVSSLFEAQVFIDRLKQGEYEELYAIESSAEQRDISSVNEQFARMLGDYHAVVDPALDVVRAVVESKREELYLYNKNATWSDQEFIPLSRIKGRIDLSFLTQPCPFFAFIDLKKREVDKETSDAVAAEVAKFYKLEGKAAALLYVAQKSVAQEKYRVEVITDSPDGENDRTTYLPEDENNEPIPQYVLHATKIVAHSPLEITSNPRGWRAK